MDGADKVRSLVPGRPDHLSAAQAPRQELERRLRARGTETEEAIQRRLEVARRELARADQYQFQVVNDTRRRGGPNEISEILEQRKE